MKIFIMAKDKDKKRTPEEREADRKHALTTLKEKGVKALAGTFWVDQSKAYGEAGERATHDFKYLPTMQNPTKNVSKLITNSLLGSRQGDQRYTGTVSEYGILNSCAAMRDNAIGKLKVQDVYELAGSKEVAPKKYAEMFVEDLAEAEGKKDKEFYAKLIGINQTAFAHKTVEEALAAERKAMVGDLEKIVKKK
jgi:hypothetical protein